MSNRASKFFEECLSLSESHLFDDGFQAIAPARFRRTHFWKWDEVELIHRSIGFSFNAYIWILGDDGDHRQLAVQSFPKYGTERLYVSPSLFRSSHGERRRLTKDLQEAVTWFSKLSSPETGIVYLQERNEGVISQPGSNTEKWLVKQLSRWSKENTSTESPTQHHQESLLRFLRSLLFIPTAETGGNEGNEGFRNRGVHSDSTA